MVASRGHREATATATPSRTMLAQWARVRAVDRVEVNWSAFRPLTASAGMARLGELWKERRDGLESNRQLRGDLLVRTDVSVQSLPGPRGHLRLLPGDPRLQHPRRDGGGY